MSTYFNQFSIVVRMNYMLHCCVYVIFKTMTAMMLGLMLLLHLLLSRAITEAKAFDKVPAGAKPNGVS